MTESFEETYTLTFNLEILYSNKKNEFSLSWELI